MQAEAIDAKVAAGDKLGPLAGVPVAVKDNICTRGMPTTAGSKYLQCYDPPYDATVVARLRQADAVIIGKTNMDEFGMGSTTENSSYMKTKNAWSTHHVPGIYIATRWRKCNADVVDVHAKPLAILQQRSLLYQGFSKTSTVQVDLQGEAQPLLRAVRFRLHWAVTRVAPFGCLRASMDVWE